MVTIKYIYFDYYFSYFNILSFSIGEREGRCSSNLVSRRHYYMSHGIGRSGDITAIQPKSSGSSLMFQLTNSLCLDLLIQLGARRTKFCLVLPVATSMGLTMCMLSLKHVRPTANYVIWSRIDQKSSFKSILAAGYIPEVIPLIRRGDELCTNITAIKQAIIYLGSTNIACVMTTTSCFAPRIPDDIPEVAKICKDSDIPHITNNAYGLQSTKCVHLIEEAMRVGRLDAFVQSTDKNILVPVGGCIIASGESSLIDAVNQIYPGRASSTPALDTFITLLHLGVKGYKQLLAERIVNYKYLLENLVKLTKAYNERVFVTPHNQISIGVTLSSFQTLNDNYHLTNLGSMLFMRFVSGTRVIPAQGNPKTIGTYTFNSFGAHCDDNLCGYLTCAAGLGITKSEIDSFITRLDSILTKFDIKQQEIQI